MCRICAEYTKNLSIKRVLRTNHACRHENYERILFNNRLDMSECCCRLFYNRNKKTIKIFVIDADKAYAYWWPGSYCHPMDIAVDNIIGSIYEISKIKIASYFSRWNQNDRVRTNSPSN